MLYFLSHAFPLKVFNITPKYICYLPTAHTDHVTISDLFLAHCPPTVLNF